MEKEPKCFSCIWHHVFVDLDFHACSVKDIVEEGPRVIIPETVGHCPYYFERTKFDKRRSVSEINDRIADFETVRDLAEELGCRDILTEVITALKWTIGEDEK